MISVVIPAYNEEKTIGACLDALVRQKTEKNFEVIVVDNNSTDNTVQVVKSYYKKLLVKVVLEKKKGRSPARRAGFAEAKGQIILSTDADTIVPPTWIEEISSYFTDPSATAVSGTCKINDCSWRINTTFNLLQPFFMKIYRLFFGHYWLSGFNFAIRKDTYEQVGGFNANLNTQEDIDLAFRVSKIDKITFISKPVVIFSGRRFRNGLLKGLYPYVRSFFDYYILKDEKRVFLRDVR